MFRVVTIEREYGSGGSAIAQRVAQYLGWRLLDSKLIDLVAEQAQVDREVARQYDECIDPWWRRIHGGALRAAVLTLGGAPDVPFFDAETAAASAQEVIAQAADRGNCVIVGRGAQCILQPSSEAFHVMLYAPWEQRIHRVQQRANVDGDVGALLSSMDRRHAAYLRRFFGSDWKNPHLYDMMVSSQLGEETVAWLIVGAVKTSTLNRRGQDKDPGSIFARHDRLASA
jgi:cytidylate kinase